MPPLSVAAFGWTLVLLGAQPSGGTLDVSLDAVGWATVAYGWQRMIGVQPAFRAARTAATGSAALTLGRLAGQLLGIPDPVLTVFRLAAVLALLLTLSLGARALLACAQPESPLVSGQASFLRWAAVGLLVVAGLAALGAPGLPTLVGLLGAATALGVTFGLWFALLQLLSSGRSWSRRPHRR